MPYVEHLPSPGLRDLVRRYWTLEEEHRPATEEHRFLPERSVRLAFYSGESLIGPAEGTRPLPFAYLLGLHDRPVRAISRGLTRALGAELYPWGAVRLLGLSTGVQDLIYPVLDPSLARLGERLRALLAAGEWVEALGELDAWLGVRAASRVREPGPAVQAALALYRGPGRVNIGELAEQLGLSPRTLERQFRAEVGLPPKALARLIRFKEAHNRLWLDPTLSLTTLAYDLGYADQAHFTRDFRSFADLNPRAFADFASARRGLLDTELQPATDG